MNKKEKMLIVKTKRRFGKKVGVSQDGESIRKMTYNKVLQIQNEGSEYYLIDPFDDELKKDYEEARQKLTEAKLTESKLYYKRR